jgi:hypothetical protein
MKFKTGNTNYTINKFYSEILISVFCVFNVSRSANNPPSIPYIDINELKKNVIIYTNNKTDIIKQNIIKELIFLYCILGKITIDDNTFATYEKSFLNNFNNATAYIKYIQQFKDKNFTTFNNNQITNVIESDAYKYIYLFLKTNKDTKDTKDIHIEDDQLFQIKNLINIVDANNAVSAIGTLEFTDQIAKYNTTQTICNVKEMDNNMMQSYKNLQGFNEVTSN